MSSDEDNGMTNLEVVMAEEWSFDELIRRNEGSSKSDWPVPDDEQERLFQWEDQYLPATTTDDLQAIIDQEVDFPVRGTVRVQFRHDVSEGTLRSFDRRFRKHVRVKDTFVRTITRTNLLRPSSRDKLVFHRSEGSLHDFARGLQEIVEYGESIALDVTEHPLMDPHGISRMYDYFDAPKGEKVDSKEEKKVSDLEESSDDGMMDGISTVTMLIIFLLIYLINNVALFYLLI